MLAFPEAKVILTVRDADSWVSSVERSLCNIVNSLDDFAVKLMYKLFGQWQIMILVKRSLKFKPAGFETGILS